MIVVLFPIKYGICAWIASIARLPSLASRGELWGVDLLFLLPYTAGLSLFEGFLWDKQSLKRALQRENREVVRAHILGVILHGLFYQEDKDISPLVPLRPY